MEKTNIMVEFRIIGDKFNVDEVTDTLKVKPTKVWNKGDAIPSNGRNREYTCWQYSTGYNETYGMISQLVKIYNIFSEKEQVLLELKEKNGLEFKIEIVIIIEKGELPAVYLDVDMITFAHKIGAKYDFDMYIN
mgnify:CR=1 FL=1|jgi:hypothetical protein|nr:DUF4279 domain-containing protein [uncultured Lachnoclostridium sp.]